MQAYTNFMHGVYDMYGIPPWEDGLSMKQKASLKFYLREYLHLPTIVIAELCNVQHYHLLRDLRALDERAVDKAVPVVMQPRYRETLEQMDDLARDMGLEPAPLAPPPSLSPSSKAPTMRGARSNPRVRSDRKNGGKYEMLRGTDDAGLNWSLPLHSRFWDDLFEHDQRWGLWNYQQAHPNYQQVRPDL